MKNLEINGKSWKQHQSWFLRGKTFSVEVKLHSEKSVFDDGTEGEFRWCVYAYVFKTHALFSTFESDRIYQAATENIPLHGGCSYLTRSPDVVKVGCDYNHLHDSFYTYLAGSEDSISVFQDANNLFDWLESRERQGEAA